MPSSSPPSALPWSEQFAVGHETIDQQHRELVSSINEIDGAVRSGDETRLAQLLRTLRMAAAAHFRVENAILWQIKTGTYQRRSSKALPRRAEGLLGDSVFERHTADHAARLLGLEQIVAASTDAIVEGLKVWFVDHAIAQDALLKAVFQALS